MDINEKLNELVIKFHVSDCVPQYQMYLKSREFLLGWMKKNSKQNLLVIGRKAEVDYFRNIIVGVKYEQIYYENMFESIEEKELQDAEMILNISFFWKDEIFIYLVNQGVTEAKINNLYDMFEDEKLYWSGDFFDIYNSGYHAFRMGAFSYDCTNFDIGLLYFQHRRRYEIAQNIEEKRKYMELLIFDCIYARDFLSMQKWIKAYINLFGRDRGKFYIAFEEAVNQLLQEIKFLLERRQSEDFLMVWLDALEYGEDKDMPFLKALDQEALSFANIYTVTPYTGATIKTLFAQARVIEEKSYNLPPIDEGNSEFIENIEKRGFEFKYHGPKKIFRKQFDACYNYNYFSTITEYYWNAIRDILLLKEGKKYFGVLHEIISTHIPYASLGLDGNEYFFTEAWPGQQELVNKNEAQILPSRKYVDEQLEFYSNLLPKRMYKMYMSDHGHTLLGRYHTIMKIQQEKIKPRCCNKVISYYYFIDIVKQLLDNYSIDETKLGNGTAIVQDVSYYYSDYIKEYIHDPNYNPDHMFAYQGIVTDTDLFIKYQNGIRYYQKHVNDEVMVSDERLEYLESLLSKTPFDVNEHDKFVDSRIIYEAERKCLERTKVIEQKKYEIVRTLFEDSDEIAVRGGGIHTLRLLMMLPYELRRKVKYIIDMDQNCLASKLGIKVVTPSEIANYSINYIVLSSYDYEKQWSEELRILGKGDWIVRELYTELTNNGITCTKEFYKRDYIKSDFVTL